jgi:hypothetical protein
MEASAPPAATAVGAHAALSPTDELSEKMANGGQILVMATAAAIEPQPEPTPGAQLLRCAANESAVQM